MKDAIAGALAADDGYEALGVLLRYVSVTHERFGPVPADAEARVMGADEATLGRWSLRLLTETTLASVLDSAKAKPVRKAALGGKHARASRA